MKTFTLEQIAQVTGGMLTKAKDVAITKIAPPLLADESTLALALGEDEINTGLLTLKNMTTGEQERLSVDDIIKKIS